jgi:hypothetical protein
MRAAHQPITRSSGDRAGFPAGPQDLPPSEVSQVPAGEGHRVWVLTVGHLGGRARHFSTRREQKAQVEQWVPNYKRLRAKLEAVCGLNHELFTLDP